MTGSDVGALEPTVASDPKGERVPFAVPMTVIFAAAVMVYAGWAAFSGTGRFRAVRVGFGVDSSIYIAAAKQPVWSLKFLAIPDGAPFLFPLLAKLCLRNLRAIVLVQSAIAAAAWWFLARTVAARLRHPAARTIAFAAFLLLALSPAILIWNVFIATESLSLSLLCVATALFIRLCGGRSARHDFAAFVVTLAALACTRDSYAVVVILIAVIATVVGIARRAQRRRAVVVAVVCIVAAVGNIAGSNHAGRWFAPLDETIAVRLLGSHDATHYLVKNGMPLNRAVRALHKQGAIVFQVHNVTYAREYRSYRHWMLTKGRATYTRYLLTHPASDFSGPFDDRRRFLRPAVDPYAVAYHVDPGPVAAAVGKVAMPESRAAVEIWIVVAVLAGIVLARRRRDRALLLTAALSSVLCLVHFLVAWHGDALELDRHIIAAAVELRIVLWIVTALVIDELFGMRRRSSGISARSSGSAGAQTQG